ncbi:hypothetical protein [Bradyrhizobium sp. sBnM-33]|uniref:hypothetical protein n=1 Tax=Bradyrhizobium sp. sBnM-33 TaxID=2831780 RepID=UPI001BCDDE66|nr:hypothetical protein [Bradyrhizobium sp. sBnM-33]WOH48812.1 hypothetical protein RX328_32690 [Bradyrhizobium sp. sBnM-33]
MLARVAHYTVQPTANSDSLQYLAEARHLLSHRSLFAYSGMEGLPDGTLRGDAHGVLWIAYLASALAFAPAADSVGQDALARVAFQFPLAAYVAGGVACASVIRLPLAIPLSVVLLLAVPGLSGTSIGGDRDAFRLAALLLLSTFLLAHARAALLHAVHPAVLMLAVVLGAWALQGHGLAIVLVPVLTGVWFLSTLILRLPAYRAILLAAAVAIGFAIAAQPVISAYLRTGSPVGDNVAASEVLKGTVYVQGTSKRDEARIGAGSDRITRIGITIARDGGWPSVVALMTLLGVTFSLASRCRFVGRHASPVVPFLLSAWFIGETLILLDALPLGHFKIGAWTVLNARYAMQWYVAAGLLAAWGIAAAVAIVRRLFPTRTMLTRALAGGVLIAGTALTGRALKHGWPVYETAVYRVFASRLEQATKALPTNCAILSEDTGVNFHATRTVVQMYSTTVLPMMRIETPQAVLDWLDSRHLCAVVLYSGLYIDTAGPDTPLARLLASDAFRLENGAPWRIYIRSSYPTMVR